MRFEVEIKKHHSLYRVISNGTTKGHIEHGLDEWSFEPYEVTFSSDELTFIALEIDRLNRVAK